jgi:hypothetical protein
MERVRIIVLSVGAASGGVHTENATPRPMLTDHRYAFSQLPVACDPSIADAAERPQHFARGRRSAGRSEPGIAGGRRVPGCKLQEPWLAHYWGG